MNVDWAGAGPIDAGWLGRVPYRDAWTWQHERRESLLAGEPVAEAVWALEHPPVLTTGLRAASGLPDAERLAAWGAEHVRVERGGLATWHAPGQLVIYTILRLPPRGLGPRLLVRGLERAMVAILADLGLGAETRADAPGAWVAGAKIGSVGVHVRRGVSMHGLALNLDMDLRPFQEFDPCGLTGARVTSVATLLGASPDPASAAERALRHVLWSLLEVSVDARRGPG